MRFDSIFRPGLFAGQTHVVTGAGSGIGRCTAHELASLGATVVLVGRKADRLETVRGEIGEAGGAAHAMPCDIRDEEQVRALITGVLERTGRIDGLVNNAGGQFAAPLASITQKGWETVVRTNLTGGFLCARECYTQWMNAHGGAIVNIVADMWGSMPGMGHSGAARAGMVSFTETRWWSGSVRSGERGGAGLDRLVGHDTYPEWMVASSDSCARRPLQRPTESETSAAICFRSPAAAFISGSVLRVDGAAPNAKLVAAVGRRPTPSRRCRGPAARPLPVHDRAPKPWNGFHLATMPRVLRER
jgi:citronellol/citronellal dehydrogenase